jgi:hypothetical protein
MTTRALAVLFSLLAMTARAEDTVHLVTLEARATRFSTQLGDSAVSILSPLGMGLSYAFRTRAAWQFSAQGVGVFGKKSVLLYGTGVHVDYALLGGQSTAYTGPDSSVFSVRYPYRVGVFLGGVQRAFSLDGYVQKTTVTFQKKLPTRGNFVGPEFGLSGEVPLGTSALVLAKVGYTQPVFLSDPEQEGALFTLSVGMGTFL